MDQELVQYISRSRGVGASDEELRELLLSVGWTKLEIDQALFEAGSHLPIIQFNNVPDKTTDSHDRFQLFFRALAFLVFLVILVAVGIFGYGMYQKNRSPERVTGKMLEALSLVSGFNYQGSIVSESLIQPDLLGNSTSSVRLPIVDVYEQSTTTVNFSGTVRGALGDRPAILLDAEWKKHKDYDDGFGGRAEFKLIDDSLYVHLFELSETSFLDLGSMVGRLVKITPADMAWLGLDSSIVAPSINQMLELRQQIAATKLITLTKFAGYETINDSNLAKYEFTADVVGLRQALGQHLDLSKYLHWNMRSDHLAGYVWLDDKNLPRQIIFTVDDSGSFVDVVVVIDDYNSPAAITIPPNSESLMNLLHSLATSTGMFKSQ